MNNLVMEVTDYLAINKAKIEINKINVICGKNSSGKSSLSKIFYSLLKGNSTKRRDYVLQGIVDDINTTIDNLNYDGNEENLPKHIVFYNNPAYIKRKYKEVLKSFETHQKIAEEKLSELNKEMRMALNNLCKKLENNGFDVNEIVYDNEIFEVDESYLSLFSDDVSKIIKEYHINWKTYLKLMSFITKMANYENIFKIEVYGKSELLCSEETQEYLNDVKIMKELDNQWELLLEIILENELSGFHIFGIWFKKMIDAFFEEDSPSLSKCCLTEIFSKEDIIPREWEIDPFYGVHFELYYNAVNSRIDACDYFFNHGLINSVYYVDNISIIDLFKKDDDKNIRLFHVNEILEDLPEKEIYEIYLKSDITEPVYDWTKSDSKQDVENIDSEIRIILEKIKNIVEGSYEKYDISYFTADKTIGSMHARHNWVNSFNTASGIKQIGIIQLLLSRNKLKKDGFLIIDEPEVNLHPDWQFKFSEILVLLAKELNITIYLNSHSPFFIEAIDAFTEYYDMQNDINYYLTEESECEGRYNFTKINSDELFKIYDNLGDAYKLIDQLRLRKRLEK